MDRIVGEVQETSCKSFQWNIPDFFSLSANNGDMYHSPNFKYGGATWRIKMHSCRWTSNFLECISLYVEKLESDIPDKVFDCCTLGVKVLDRNFKLTQRSVAILKNKVWGWDKYDERSNVLKERDQLAPEGVLTVLCNLCLEQSSGTVLQPANEERGVDQVAQDLKTLFLNEEDFDVTLKIKGRDFRAHKLILRARSPVFSAMFKHDMWERSSGIVNIIDCDPDAFQHFLLYLYSGKVENMSTSIALSLYSVADKYGVDDLKEDCVRFLKAKLAVDTFGDVILLAVRHGESSLIETATAFYAKHLQEILLTIKWKSFIMENPIAANELTIKALNNFPLNSK